MLILILTIIMLGVKTNSLCSDFCECNSLPLDQSVGCDSFNQCQLNKDQKLLMSELTSENGSVKFLDSSTVDIKISEINLNFSEHDLNWIKTLILNENNFTSIPAFVTEFTGIQSLDLSQNDIESIDDNCFRTLNLKVLNLSTNSISNLSNISFPLLNNLTNLDLSKNILSTLDCVIDLPNLQYFNLSNNYLKTLSADVFNNLKLLQHLDISRNKLAGIAPIQLPNLISFVIAGNSKLGRSRDIFLLGSGRKMQSLDASRIGLQQVPAILTDSIQHLMLNKNLIKTINSGDLDSYPLLNSLDATSNGIKFIEEDSVGRLEFLSVLYLTDNQLEEIPRRLPEKLKVLRLDINKIGAIRKKDLQGLPVLEVLFLNDNNVSVINEAAFSELISLVSLDLSRNPIINLQAGVFAGPLSLAILQLSSVRIPINEDAQFPLSVPERLLTLNLSSSPGLAHQFLSDTATLMAAKRLQELDLTGGNLEFIRQDLQFFLPQLKLLHISGNKFNTSQINWLKSWFCVQAENDEASGNSRRLADYNYEFLNLSTSPPSGRELKQFKDRAKSLTKVELHEYGLTSQNVNEGDDFQVNEVYHTDVLSKFSQELFSSYKKYPGGSQEENNEIVRSRFYGPVDRHDDSIKWNVSTGEISMYKSEKKNYLYHTLFLVISTALVVFTISVFLIIRLFKIRRTYIDAEDIESTALPTISDIW